MDVEYGAGNAEYNRNESRVSSEVYDIYCFLHAHPTMAPNRRKDVLRASVNYTPFGYIFEGIVSERSASTIDQRLRDGVTDPCLGMQRDHFYTWKETAAFLFSEPLMQLEVFWAELRRRNEVVLLLKEEHSRVGIFQRQGHGLKAYDLAGIQLLQVDRRALRLSGNKGGLVARYWPQVQDRRPYQFGEGRATFT